MSDETKQSFKPESQQERWVKYGANVVLTIVVAVALAIGVMVFAQRARARIDTTATNSYSLKPQTLSLIQNLKQPVKLVSLYSRQTTKGASKEQVQTVQDLLAEYKRKGKNIDVEYLDPDETPAKADALVQEVTDKYGGEVKKYKDFLDADYKAAAEQVKKLLTAEAGVWKDLPQSDAIRNRDVADKVDAIRNTLESWLAKEIDKRDKTLGRRLEKKPPDYVGAVADLQTSMDAVSEAFGVIAQQADQLKDVSEVPEPIRKHLTDIKPALESAKKLVDDTIAKAKNLGELKLDTLRQNLHQSDTILVMGPSEMRVLPYEQVWKIEDALKNYVREGKVKPQFAGEQQVSTAIFAVTQEKKQRVVFVRPSGAPLANPGFPPFQPGGPMSQVADRLRDYGFEVLEKDLSGQYAMQAQMRGMPPEPEASDEQLKDSIWVVMAAPMGGGQFGAMPSPIGPKLQEHLKAGGSALVMVYPQEDSIAGVLAPYGIDLRADAVAVHESPPPDAQSSGDQVEDLRRVPYVFDIRDYGGHPLTRPLQSLESFIAPMMVVKTSKDLNKEAANVTPILPLPDAPKAPRSWGETDINGLQNGDPPKFDEKSDIAGPIYGGAVAELKSGGRVVLVASPTFAWNRTLNEPDPDLARRGYIVSRFPGNGELFANSVFWLAKMETMIAISPRALEVSRIAPMSDAALNAWRVGVLLVGLPGLVLAGGVTMYLKRRD